MSWIFTFVSVALAADPAPAEAPPPEVPPTEVPEEPDAIKSDTVAIAEYLVAVHVGPTFAIAGLQPTVLPRLEVGVVPSAMHRRLHLFGTFSYARPVAEGSAADPRLPSGTYDWRLTQQEVQLGLGVSYDFLPRSEAFHPDLTVAPQLYLLDTRVDGHDEGAAFGESKETYAQPGLSIAAGFGYDIGPGRLIGRVQVDAAPLVGQVTGKSHTTALAPTVGYRMYF